MFDTNIRFMVESEEKWMFERCAEERKETLSQWIRGRLRDAAKEEYVPEPYTAPPATSPPDLPKPPKLCTDCGVSMPGMPCIWQPTKEILCFECYKARQEARA